MPILRVSAVPVGAEHMMALSDVRELSVSPAHPTADGRLVEQLKAGAVYNGALGKFAALERYRSDDQRTFDLLPDGDTGFYWASGILLASTLR